MNTKTEYNHLETFLKIRASSAPDSINSIEEVAKRFVLTPNAFLKSHSFKKPTTCLLVGHVQSGKTGHYLGVIAAVADQESRFPVFILLTQNSVPLHTQTLSEARKALPKFEVFGELDQLEFRSSFSTNLPKLIVLKKQKDALTKWKTELPKPLLAGRSLFIVDDEADATGLNTEVRKGGQSSINSEVDDFIKIHNSFLLQVTATPQSIFKLDPSAGHFKPQSHLYFPPGRGYLGGDFFFPSDFDPGSPPYMFRETPVAELVALQDPSTKVLPVGLRNAMLTWLITASYRIVNQNDKACNFLIHPSITKIDHELVKRKILDFLREIRSQKIDLSTLPEFEACYKDLKKTKPQLPPLYKIIDDLNLLAPNVLVLNSAKGNLTREIPKDGANVFIGGNVLSRGIVLPNLQTTYYCRSSTRPNLDTYWQHSRCFGYDRDQTLIRVFMPQFVYSTFCQMNDSTERLFESLANNATEDIRIVTPAGIRASRPNVYLDDRVIVGGASYFPTEKNDQSNFARVNAEIPPLSEIGQYLEVSSSDIQRLLALTHDGPIGSNFITSDFVKGIAAVKKDTGKELDCILIVRRGRNIGANTGSLLSPDDRVLAHSFTGKSVLVLYQVLGSKDKGWEGTPFWIPNIKLPVGMHVHLN
jgi:hypothetical protein